MITPTLFSILVANYNNGHYIAECLDSLIKQDYESIEIIIVDDASTDNSIHIIKQYQNQHPNIFLFHNSENKGVGYTKKRCIDEAKGEILGFVDPDDAIIPQAISKMVKAQQQYPQAALIYSNYYDCNEKLQVIKKYSSFQVHNGDPNFLNQNGHIGPFASFKKKYYENTGGLNTYLKRAIDQDLYLKLYDVGDCVHLDEALYYYRMHDKGLATHSQTDLAYYWYWVVCILRAQEKNIDLEQNFNHTFIRRAKVKHWLSIDKIVRKNWLFKLIAKSFK
jgi:glycosyltransferase involved in cell wall biosynthesis